MPRPPLALDPSEIVSRTFALLALVAIVTLAVLVAATAWAS